MISEQHLPEAQELSQDGQLMQKEAHNWLATKAFHSKMEGLLHDETARRFQIWQTVILSEVSIQDSSCVGL